MYSYVIRILFVLSMHLLFIGTASAASSGDLLKDSSARLVFIKRTLPYNSEYQFQCSGTFVSNDGLILTAQHCLVPLLEFTEKDEMDPAELFRKMLNLKLLVKVDKIGFLGRRSLSRTLNARVVSIGSDLDIVKHLNKSQPNMDHMIAELEDLAKQGIGPQSDWVLLKIDGISKTACLKISVKDGGEKESVLHLGFPGPSEESKDGTQFLTASGRLDRDKAKECNAKAVLKLEETIKESRSSLARMAELILGGGDASTAQIKGGMSGGAVVNAEGQLVGLNMALNSLCPEISYFTPIRNILKGIERLHKLQGTPTAAELFKCR